MAELPTNSVFDKQSLKLRYVAEFPIKELPGFKKTFRLPTYPGPAANSFLGKLVEENLKAEFQSTHKYLRDFFGLKRKEIEITLEPCGAILESTPFRIQKTFTFKGDNLDIAQCDICLDQIDDLNSLVSPGNHTAFPFRFTILEIDSKSGMEVEKMIDLIEEMDLEKSGSIRMDYDFAATECQIQLLPSSSILWLRSNGIQLCTGTQKQPAELIEEMISFGEQLFPLFN